MTDNEVRTQKRFGTIAVELGFMNPDLLAEALKIQVGEDLEKGTHRRIGTICYDQGWLNASQIKDILNTMDSLSKFAV